MRVPGRRPSFLEAEAERDVDGQTCRRWLAGACYLLGALLVVGGAAVGEVAVFLLGLALLTAALVLANW